MFLKFLFVGLIFLVEFSIWACVNLMSSQSSLAKLNADLNLTAGENLLIFHFAILKYCKTSSVDTFELQIIEPCLKHWTKN